MRKDLIRRAIWELAPLWVIVLLFVLFWGFCELNGPVRQYLNRRTFDPELWKNASSAERYDLAWDLYHGRLNGLTRAEVVELLGEPNEPGDASQTWCWYSLGGHYGMVLDIDDQARLFVTFKNDRVVSVDLK